MRYRYRYYRFPHVLSFWLALLCLVPIAASVSGCGSGRGCTAGFITEHTALEVTAARNTRTGASVPRVVLSDIRFNGTPVTDLRELVPERLARGVTVSGDTLECEIPCAFGSGYGRYQFTVSAPGYQSKREELTGGARLPPDACFGGTIGSTEVEFALDPQ